MVRFFEAINGRSATEEEIAAALAAGEFQDDAPAVETAPTQEAPAQPQPTFASAQECSSAQEAQNTSPRGATTANFRWCPRSATTADFCECPRSASASSFCKCSGSPSTTNLCGCSSYSSTRSAKSSSATTSWFCQSSAGQQAAFANGQPLQPGQNVQFINGQAVVVPAQPSAFATTFKTTSAWRRPADSQWLHDNFCECPRSARSKHLLQMLRQHNNQPLRRSNCSSTRSQSAASTSSSRSKRSIYQWQAKFVPAQPSAFATTFKNYWTICLMVASSS